MHFKHSDLPRGVYKCRSRFVTSIRENGKLIHIGMFATAEEAAQAYEAFVGRLISEGRLPGHPYAAG